MARTGKTPPQPRAEGGQVKPVLGGFFLFNRWPLNVIRLPIPTLCSGEAEIFSDFTPVRGCPWRGGFAKTQEYFWAKKNQTVRWLVIHRSFLPQCLLNHGFPRIIGASAEWLLGKRGLYG
jgi:hypothetical protein